MKERGYRIGALADTICRGKRHEAADNHIESDRTYPGPRPRRKQDRHDIMRWSFLAGWDAAMNVSREELLEENTTLHGMVIDLCQRLAVKRCPKCNGLGVAGNFDPCGCDNGWVDAPAGEPEQIVADVKRKAGKK